MTVKVLFSDKDPGAGEEHDFFVGQSVLEIYAHLRRVFSHRYACTLADYHEDCPEADLALTHGVAFPYDDAFLTFEAEGRIDDIMFTTLKLYMPHAGQQGGPLEFTHRVEWEAYNKGYNTTNPRAYQAKVQMVKDVFETLEHHTTHWETEGVTHRWGGFDAPRVSKKAHRKLEEIGYTRVYEGINVTRYACHGTHLEVYHTHAIPPRWGNVKVAPDDVESARAWLTDARRAVDMWEAACRTVFTEPYLQRRKSTKRK